MLKKRYSYIQKWKRKRLQEIQLRDSKIITERFLNSQNCKKILIMNASPFMADMLQQRPHHFLNFWAKHFDIVLYRSYLINEPILYKDNIYLVPCLPDGQFKDKDIYYYMSSVNCVSYKTFLKLKKNNYKIIYDYYDEISRDIICPNNALKVHRKMKKVDPQIIIASSDRLFESIKKTNPQKDILLVKNGVTLKDFEVKTDDIPKDLIPIIKENKPIIGFFGYIAKWTDIELLEKTFTSYPEYNFVFIGKICLVGTTNIENYQNCHFLGHKQYHELVNYSKHFDCAIIPFKHGNIAKATSPNKLFEYMAMGLPTVCTRDLVECIGYDGVLMSENNEEFILNIKKALNLSKDENVRAKLKLYAAQNSWESKANEIFEKIKELM